MKKFLVLLTIVLLNACTTKYILMDESGNPVKDDYYSENTIKDDKSLVADASIQADVREGIISGNDVFVVSEGQNFVTYEYKNVRVDEISPLASLYCADVSFGGSPYLREVSMFRNGFMRATFDCVSVAI